MTLPLNMTMLKLASVVLVALGVFFTVVTAQHGDSVLGRFYRMYTGHLNRQIKLLFLDGSGERIFVVQAWIESSSKHFAEIDGGKP